jgi:hypothetical protein
MKTASLLFLALSLMAQNDLPRATERSRAMNQDPSVDYYDSISDYFRTSPRAVIAINQKGIAVEEIPAVLTIARKSAASPNQIIDAHKAGKSWADIAKQNNVKLSGDNFVDEANILFLSEYHSRPAQEVRAMRAKGATFVAINQEYRRNGAPMPKKTAK